MLVQYDKKIALLKAREARELRREQPAQQPPPRQAKRRRPRRRYHRRARPIPAERLPEIQETVRQAWANNHYGHHAAEFAAKATGLTIDQCRRIATGLGLTFTRERYRWTDAEIEIVERNAHHSFETIQKRLQKAGVSPIKRTRAAIAQQINASRFRRNLDGMNKQNLAAALGVSDDQVTKWTEAGMLRPQAVHRQNLRKEDDAITRIQYYPSANIRRFIFSFPGAIDLRRVNQVWFIELMARAAKAAPIVQPYLDRRPSTADRQPALYPVHGIYPTN